MLFRYTILYVEQVADTLEFYQRAFGLPIAMLHESGDYGELETGTTRLAFSSLALMEQLGKPAGRAASQPACFEIALETDDVSSALAKAVDAGATLEQSATDMPWGQTVGYVKDLNGFLVEICTPVTPPDEAN